MLDTPVLLIISATPPLNNKNTLNAPNKRPVPAIGNVLAPPTPSAIALLINMKIDMTMNGAANIANQTSGLDGKVECVFMGNSFSFTL